MLSNLLLLDEGTNAEDVSLVDLSTPISRFISFRFISCGWPNFFLYLFFSLKFLSFRIFVDELLANWRWIFQMLVLNDEWWMMNADEQRHKNANDSEPVAEKGINIFRTDAEWQTSSYQVLIGYISKDSLKNKYQGMNCQIQKEMNRKYYLWINLVMGYIINDNSFYSYTTSKKYVIYL